MGRSLERVIILLHFLSEVIYAELEYQCKESRCSDQGPAIRFPFRLKGHQEPADRCGYPGFDLYCNERNQTVLNLTPALELSVKTIFYESQEIRLYDPQDCLAKTLQNLDLSASPFQTPYIGGLAMFNCSSTIVLNLPVTCLDVPGYHVYAVFNDSSVFSYPLVSCTKIPVSLPDDIFYGNEVQLKWATPICGICEEKGMKCRFKKKNSTQLETECFKPPKDAAAAKRFILIAGVVLGFILLVLVFIVLYRVRNSNKLEKEHQVKVEKFLEDYKALKPTRYSYADIKRITNKFKEKLGQGGYGTVFKGKLSNEILVAVKILNNSKGNGDEFINEVGTMGTIHHVNVVRLVGFCADGFRRALVYEFLPNESLEKYIFSADRKERFLGWERLQDIVLGIAKGIEYLHEGCDRRILHFDIKPHNILLDHNFNPKISDFGLAKLCSKDQSAVSMTAARGTMGYIAPEVLSRNFGNVSCKSDVYSFGMLLLEMVGGRKNIHADVESTSQVNFPKWVYDHLNQGQEVEIRIEEEKDAKIAKKLTLVGLWCIQWYPVDRPSMKVVIQMLEGLGNKVSMPPNPFGFTIQNQVKCNHA